MPVGDEMVLIPPTVFLLITHIFIFHQSVYRTEHTDVEISVNILTASFILRGCITLYVAVERSLALVIAYDVSICGRRNSRNISYL